MDKLNRNGWTPERRRRQAEAIRSWQPWLKSTGAKTDAGKARAAQNAVTHGNYTQANLERKRRYRENMAVFRAALAELKRGGMAFKL